MIGINYSHQSSRTEQEVMGYSKEYFRKNSSHQYMHSLAMGETAKDYYGIGMS